MKNILDAFWRAILYCLHPRVIALSILPLVIMAAAALALGFFFWDAAMDMVRANLESYELANTMLGWLERVGLHSLRVVLAPLIVLFLSIPVIVTAALLLVAWMMTPALVSLVAERRFHSLERKKGGSVLTSIAWSLGSTLLAFVAMLVSAPLWFIWPLVLVLPPLIWGWLTYRVMAYDALVDHASREERQQIFRELRLPLFGYWRGERLHGCRPQRVVGFGGDVHGVCAHPDAAGNLDLHLGAGVFLLVVRALHTGCPGSDQEE
jgi:Etoposide-induced protein 2.4 (EI24)